MCMHTHVTCVYYTRGHSPRWQCCLLQGHPESNSLLIPGSNWAGSPQEHQPVVDLGLVGVILSDCCTFNVYETNTVRCHVLPFRGGYTLRGLSLGAAEGAGETVPDDAVPRRAEPSREHAGTAAFSPLQPPSRGPPSWGTSRNALFSSLPSPAAFEVLPPWARPHQAGVSSLF